MDPISVFLAEGEKHVREALHLLLDHQGEFAVAGEAGNAESLLAQVCQQPPDVILLDWELPGLHPQRLIRTLREYCPATRILGTSVKPEQEKTALEFGVDSFVSKQLPSDRFLAKLVCSINPQCTDQLTRP